MTSFDYNAPARRFRKEIPELMPQDLSEENQKYIIDKVVEFAIVAGKGISKDSDVDFDDEEMEFLTQLISEWTFHKTIDLIRSGIEEQYFDKILEKVAFCLYEIAKQSISQKMESDRLLNLAERYVDKTFIREINDLYNNGNISAECRDKALEESNIDKMAQERLEKEHLNKKSRRKIIIKHKVLSPAHSSIDKKMRLFFLFLKITLALALAAGVCIGMYIAYYRG